MDPRGDLRDPTLRGPLRPPPGQHSHRGAMHGATGPLRMQRGASHVAAAHCNGARDGVRVSQNIGRRCGGGCEKSDNGRRPERSLTSECLKRARRPAPRHTGTRRPPSALRPRLGSGDPGRVDLLQQRSTRPLAAPGKLRREASGTYRKAQERRRTASWVPAKVWFGELRAHLAA